MARKVRSRRRLLVAAVVVALVALVGIYGWWELRHWRPDPRIYPVQGVEVGAGDGAVNWRTLKAIGATFAYLDASAGASARDPAFIANLEKARAAGLQVGAVHRYDPCQPGDRQAANFVVVVPRDPTMLPPAVELSATGDDCPQPVSGARIESELTTFLNEIETHTGKPALLKLGAAFEKRYGIASAIDRNLWLGRDRFPPAYAERPWALWTANRALHTEAGDHPLRWVVLHP
jgi:lysozyme